MDKIEKYKSILRQFFINRKTIQNEQSSGLKGHLLISEHQTNYMLVKMGWLNKLFVHTVVFHIEIKHEKIWIYEDKTDVDVPNILVENGVEKKDIVLGYLSPKLRTFSEYAVA